MFVCVCVCVYIYICYLVKLGGKVNPAAKIQTGLVQVGPINGRKNESWTNQV